MCCVEAMPEEGRLLEEVPCDFPDCQSTRHGKEQFGALSSHVVRAESFASSGGNNRHATYGNYRQQA